MGFVDNDFVVDKRQWLKEFKSKTNYGGQLIYMYIINSVDRTKLSCNTPTDAAP